MAPAVVEVKVVNMGLSPSLSASQWEGLSTMGYRHTEPFAKSATQREMFGSGSAANIIYRLRKFK